MSKYILVIFLFCSCSVGFKGTSIPAEVKTFTVENVIDNSYNAPSTYPTDFQVALSNKIRRESKLKANDRDPNLTYKVSISNFAVSSQAPVSGAVSAINRLEIVVQVQAIYSKNESLNWSKNFSRFTEFDANTNFSTIENQLTTALNKLLTEDIFIASFSNW